MTDRQTEVLQWWYGNRNYQMGIVLLSKYSKNKILVHTLMKPGKEGFGGRNKLNYELPKAVGLHFKNMPLLPGDIIPDPVHNPSDEIGKTPADPQNEDGDPYLNTHAPVIPLNQYPKVIRRLKYEYQEHYQLRSISHKKMTSVPAVNSIGNMLLRSNLLIDIKRCSSQMDYLYKFITDYENNGVVPGEEIVWPQKAKATKTELPDDIIQLKKMKHRLQNLNSKANRILLYQHKIKKIPNPLPKGVRRTNLKRLIKSHLLEISLINAKIKTLNDVN